MGIWFTAVHPRSRAWHLDAVALAQSHPEQPVDILDVVPAAEVDVHERRQDVAVAVRAVRPLAEHIVDDSCVVPLEVAVYKVDSSEGKDAGA